MTRKRLAPLIIASLILAACGAPVPAEPSIPEDDPALSIPEVQAEAPPGTDIYLADLSFNDGTLIIETVRGAVTDAGYDNQPAFLPGSTAFYYASAGASGKTDIWRHDPVVGTSRQITVSPERSEYSPRLGARAGETFFIQESPDGQNTTLNVIKAADDPGEAAINLAPLGYYAWFDSADQVAVFLRSEPPSLHVINVETGTSLSLADNIGRGLYASPDDGGVLFTVTRPDGSALLREYRADTDSLSTLFPLVGAAQDYAVFELEDGSRAFLCASDDTLYFRADTEAGEWSAVFDLAEAGLSGVTRLAVSDDLSTLAIVASE